MLIIRMRGVGRCNLGGEGWRVGDMGEVESEKKKNLKRKAREGKTEKESDPPLTSSAAHEGGTLHTTPL